MKTSQLTGAALDWAVAECEGIELTNGRYNRLLVEGRMSRGQEMMRPYNPSSDWAQGGPLIERLCIDLQYQGGETDVWGADMFNADSTVYGDTPLIAAMRCYVTVLMGDEIYVPEELKEAE